jgi:transcriptional regulator with XRE-family HTH domain
VAVDYEEIGQRLRAFRLGSGMSAEEIARRIGISRTAVYRFEKGEVVKIETLISFAQLLGVSLPTLLGVEMEYISSAVTYFERVRQLEETADRIVILAGPLSFLLASENFHELLFGLLRESHAGEPGPSDDRAVHDIERIMTILGERKKNYALRRPAIVNLMSGLDIERLLRSGFVGRPFASVGDIRERKRLAAEEVEHFARLMDEDPIGIQIGLVTGSLPHVGFQIFRSGMTKTLTISPFRLGEPNIRLGVAMITRADEPISLHERIVESMWQGALKGPAAASYLRNLIAAVRDGD